MNNSRRRFLKIAGLSFLGLGGSRMLPPFAQAAQSAPSCAAQGPAYEKGAKSLQAGHWGMVIDTRGFDDPNVFAAVVTACHKYHNIPEIKSKQEVKWLWKAGYHEAFTDQADNYPPKAMIERQYLLLCNHCVNPACVRVCPTQATFRRSDGIVVMDYHRCIGCRYCMAACPFGARSFNFRDPRPFVADVNPAFPTRMRGVVEKCTFCSELLAAGEMPLCVKASQGAIAFGDLSDPDSNVRKLLAENFTLRRKPTLGTDPSVYYII
jgi:molybdopterin-containing oxidoreductase family iron-sulfur binding subunit